MGKVTHSRQRSRLSRGLELCKAVRDMPEGTIGIMVSPSSGLPLLFQSNVTTISPLILGSCLMEQEPSILKERHRNVALKPWWGLSGSPKFSCSVHILPGMYSAGGCAPDLCSSHLGSPLCGNNSLHPSARWTGLHSLFQRVLLAGGFFPPALPSLWCS